MAMGAKKRTRKFREMQKMVTRELSRVNVMKYKYNVFDHNVQEESDHLKWSNTFMFDDLKDFTYEEIIKKNLTSKEKIMAFKRTKKWRRKSSRMFTMNYSYKINLNCDYPYVQETNISSKESRVVPIEDMIVKKNEILLSEFGFGNPYYQASWNRVREWLKENHSELLL